MRSSLRGKILLGYGLSLMMVGGVLFWAVLNLKTLGQASDAILSENYKSILAAENMIEAIERQDSSLLLYLLGYRKEAMEQFTYNEGQFLPWLGRARDNITIEGEGRIIDAIGSNYHTYLQHRMELLRIFDKDQGRAVQYYHSTILSTFSDVRKAATQLREINQETMFAASARAERIAARASFSMIGIGGAALILGLVFSLILSTVIARPVRKMGVATQLISEGNYDVHIDSTSHDELGRLADSFNAMIAKLRSYHHLNIGKIMEEKRKNDAIIRSIDDGILLIDDQLSVTNMNPAAERMFDLRFEEAGQLHLLELINNPELFAFVKEVVEEGKNLVFEDGENTLTVEHEEETRYYQFFLTPVLSPERKRLGIVLLFRDITKLKEIDRLKDEFLMTASHELKTPLTSIEMSIGLLRENLAGGIDGKDAEMLEVAGAELARLKSLVSDLLDLSKIESGNIALEFEPVEAETLVEKACSVLHAQAEEKPVHLAWTVNEGTGRVRADAGKIGWVLTNLIANALRYTEPEGHIEVRGRRAGGFVYFSVADDGCGIPQEYQSKIFDKFVQVKSGGREGGTGLGLTICREIVRAHGGTIWVESETGKGSVFTFTIPVEGARYEKQGDPYRGR